MDDLMGEILKHSHTGRPKPSQAEIEQAMIALQEQMAYIYDLLNEEFERLKNV